MEHTPNIKSYLQYQLQNDKCRWEHCLENLKNRTEKFEYDVKQLFASVKTDFKIFISTKFDSNTTLLPWASKAISSETYQVGEINRTINSDCKQLL